MRKSDVLRLKPGDIVLFADHQYSSETNYTAEGRVLHVTPRGGVRVRITDGPFLLGIGSTVGMKSWVPYHHVVSRVSKATREQTSNNHVTPNEDSIFE